MSKKDFVLIGIMIALVIVGLSLNHIMSPQKIAYINTSEVLDKYNGMIDARKKFDQTSKMWKNNLDTLALEFQDDLKTYEKGLAAMTVKEKELTQKVLQNKQQELIQYQQAISQKAQEEEGRLTDSELKKIKAFIEKYGKNNGYKLILGSTAGSILYGNDASEITDEVLDGLNKEYGK